MFIQLWGSIDSLISPLIDLVGDLAPKVITWVIKLIEFLFEIIEWLGSLFGKILDFFKVSGHGGGGFGVR